MQLAQLDIVRLLADPDSSEVAEFMTAIPAINSLGEVGPGFVTILQGENEPWATGIRLPGQEGATAAAFDPQTSFPAP